jgi:membrane-associated phospholipid phosphatase
VTARRDPRLLIVGALLIGLPFLFGLLLIAGADQPAHHAALRLDDAWQRWSAGSTDGGLPYRIAIVLNLFGRPEGKLVAGGITITLLVLRKWWAVAFYWTGIGLAAGVSQGLKHLVDRERPAGILVVADHGSLPSGHVIQAASLVVMIAALLPAAGRRHWLIFGVGCTLAMMWSRTYLRAHWLTDTIAGLSAGVGVGLLCCWAFAPLLRPSRSPDSSADPRLASTSAGADRPR